jgi:aminopeptidase N
MDTQENITKFESKFNGPFPFEADGIIVGTPKASFEEEMEGMITFAGSSITSGTLYHENMHQWWGDHVTEANYSMTFYKEGLATLAEYLDNARQAETAAGGPGTAAGRAAFEASLVATFNEEYHKGNGGFWSLAPSTPTPHSLFSNAETYQRPGAAYVALRQILGPTDFDDVLQQIQKTYGGGNITEKELEAAFHQGMPNQSHACSQRLDDFFAEWFDTSYPLGGKLDRPQITGPGLAGAGFYDSSGGCS